MYDQHFTSQKSTVMKTKAFLIVLMMGCLAVSCNLNTKEKSSADLDNPAFKAYELRMNGHADKAYTLLEQTLAEDSANALAWYEYSRTYLHYRPEEKSMEQTLNEILNAAIKAIELDPDNAVFYPFANLALDINISWIAINFYSIFMFTRSIIRC